VAEAGNTVLAVIRMFTVLQVEMDAEQMELFVYYGRVALDHFLVAT